MYITDLNLAVGNKINDIECLYKGKFALVKECNSFGRLDAAAFFAHLPNSLIP